MLTLTDILPEKEADYQLKNSIERKMKLKLEQSEETLAWFLQRRKTEVWKFGSLEGFPSNERSEKRERENQRGRKLFSFGQKDEKINNYFYFLIKLFLRLW